jgi:hypothetical protein
MVLGLQCQPNRQQSYRTKPSIYFLQESCLPFTMSQTQVCKVLRYFFMLQKIESWKKVIDDKLLLASIAGSNLEDVASMTSLRKKWSVEEIAIAAELVEGRKKARGKLDNACAIVSDSSGVQQATSSAIALHKANRFEGQVHSIDLCCGIGSDLQALPDSTIGLDNDPLRCWMAEENTGKAVRCCDARTFVLPASCVVHIDPARRNHTGRIFELDGMLPTFSEVVTIAKGTCGGCIKLSPAINREDITSLSHPFEIEYIEENNRLVQGAVWFGSLLRNEGTTIATSMRHGISYSGISEQPTFSNEVNAWILEPNVALERAGLHGTLGNELGATELAPGIGLLTSSKNPTSPWFTAFEVLATTSLRLEKVAAILREVHCTQVEVKTRGKTIDPNQWQKKLNKKSTGPLLTIFALRLGKKRIALVTRRCVAL